MTSSPAVLRAKVKREPPRRSQRWTVNRITKVARPEADRWTICPVVRTANVVTVRIGWKRRIDPLGSVNRGRCDHNRSCAAVNRTNRWPDAWPKGSIRSVGAVRLGRLWHCHCSAQKYGAGQKQFLEHGTVPHKNRRLRSPRRAMGSALGGTNRTNNLILRSNNAK
jgi:hypothetical protein